LRPAWAIQQDLASKSHIIIIKTPKIPQND
jgi:hypothetical protein